jgi:hypothetical protein
MRSAFMLIQKPPHAASAHRHHDRLAGSLQRSDFVANLARTRISRPPSEFTAHHRLTLSFVALRRNRLGVDSPLNLLRRLVTGDLRLQRPPLRPVEDAGLWQRNVEVFQVAIQRTWR